MKNMKKIIILLMIINLLLIPFFTSATADKINVNIPNNVTIVNFNEGYSNLTVHETWKLIQTESNGVQYLIDVRTKEEYENERISTPSVREKPRLYPLQWLEDESLLKSFMDLYWGKEIILYCRSANRSFIAAKILIENGFEGKIYNMEGGIKVWKSEGLPVIKGTIKQSFLTTSNLLILKLLKYPFFINLLEKLKS
jgi:rhodanese-related sulfurtransferase